MTLLNDCFLRTARGEELSRTPVWIMRQAGRYLPEYRKLRSQVIDFIDFCHTPELCCEATLQPLARFDLDAAIIFNDILTLPNSMGAELHFSAGVGPVFSQPVRTLQDVKALNDVDADDMGYVMRAIKMTHQALHNRVPLIGFAGSPWTVASYMVEGTGSKVWPTVRAMRYRNSSLLHTLLERLTQNTVRYLNGQIAAGADAIMLFDSWGGVLAHDSYREFSLQYLEAIIAQLHCGEGAQRVPVIVFTKQGYPWLDAIAASGCQVVAVDGTVDPVKAARYCQRRSVALQGNLDPFCLYATPDEIQQAVFRILGACQGVPHIMNLGHGIDKGTPIAGVEAMIKAVREFESQQASS